MSKSKCITTRMCCVDPAVNLVDAIQWLTGSTTTSIFSVGHCFAHTRITVTVTVLTESEIITVSDVKTDKNGKFTVKVLAGTQQLDIKVRIVRCGQCFIFTKSFVQPDESVIL